MKTSHLLAIAALAASVAACDDSIQEGWLVDRTRVLGARVEAAGDLERASLAPGESGRISWLVAMPEDANGFAWAFAACLPPEGNFADPACETTVLLTGSGTAAGELVPMDIAVPPAEELGQAEELLVLAAFCSDGSPDLDAGTFTATCASGEPLLASLLVRVANAGAANANPPPLSVRLGKTVLPADEGAESAASCDAAPNAPEIVAGGPKEDLVYVFDGTEREADESLLLSTFVTSGKLDRQYSALGPEEATPKKIHVPWTPPGVDAAGEAGLVVRFYVVLRDGRGGASFARFPVCVRAR
jgi:hypothetical protein